MQSTSVRSAGCRVFPARFSDPATYRTWLLLILLVPAVGAAAIPVRQWVDMEATAAMGPEASKTDSVEPDYRAYSSMEATDDGRIIYWGGGHGNYGGNDMDVYHVADNQWRQETAEENWKTDLESWNHLGTNGQPTKEKVERVYNTGPVADFLTGRGRPGTRHSYQQATWWPEKGWFVFDFKHSLWAWDPEQGDANGAFMKIYDGNANQGYADIQFWNIRYDPPSGSLVSFNSGDNSAYRLRDGQWQKVMDVPFPDYKGEVYSEFHEADQVHYAARFSDLLIVDLAEGTSTDIPDTPPQAAGNNQWIEYSPEREQMLVMGFDENGLGVWGYNPDAQEWEVVDVQGEVMRPDGNPITNQDIRWDMLERDPVSGNYYFLSFRKGAGYQSPDMYAFRLSEDAGQPAPVDPSPHPENQWVSLPLPDTHPGIPSGNGKDFQFEYREATGNLIMGFGDWLQKDGTKANGNEHIFEIDFETNDWTAIQEPCTGGLQPDGWDEVGVAIRNDELWGFPGYSWTNDSCTTDTSGETMAFDLGSHTWRITGHGRIYITDVVFIDYDPVNDKFYMAGRPGVYEVDPDPAVGKTEYTDEHDHRLNRHQMFLDVKGRAAYLTDRGPTGGGDEDDRIIKFGLDSKEFATVAEIPEGTKVNNSYAVWDPVHRAILAPIGANTGGKVPTGEVRIYHVDLGIWQSINYPDDGTVPFGNTPAYDEDSELLVQLGSTDYPTLHDAFVLEYKPQTTGTVEPWVTDGESPVVNGHLLALPVPPGEGRARPTKGSVRNSEPSGRDTKVGGAERKPTDREANTGVRDEKRSKTSGRITFPEGQEPGTTIRLVPPELTFTASQKMVRRGEPVMLSWDARKATRCKASGAWDGPRDLQGEAWVRPSTNSLYQLTCASPVGKSSKSLEIAVE